MGNEEFEMGESDTIVSTQQLLIVKATHRSAETLEFIMVIALHCGFIVNYITGGKGRFVFTAR